MLEAGSSTRVRNRGGLTPIQLVDPANKGLRELIQKHEYAALSAGDFVNVDQGAGKGGKGGPVQPEDDEEEAEDEDAEFSGSDDEERAEWERRRNERRR